MRGVFQNDTVHHVLIDKNLQKHYRCQLLVAAVTVVLISKIAVAAGTIGLLLRSIAVTPTASTSIRPVSVLGAATTVPTGARCVVLRIPPQLLPFLQ